MQIKNVAVFWLQTLLSLFYIWFSLINAGTSLTLSEWQRNPQPEGTPLQHLMDGSLFFAVVVALMICLMVCAANMRMKVKVLCVLNIIFPCLAVGLRFIPFLIYLSLSGELKYWTYILINEIAFMLFNALLLVSSIIILHRSWKLRS